MNLESKELTLICQPSADGDNLFCWLDDKKQDKQSVHYGTDDPVMEILCIDDEASCQVKIHPRFKALIEDVHETGEITEQSDDVDFEGETL